MRLHDFSVLTIDCYGTLIDWESGIVAALAPLIGRAGVTLDRNAILETFAMHEVAVQSASPTMAYTDVLTNVHDHLAAGWGAAPDPAADRRFGASVPDWPAFADTPGALQYLKQHYRLVILSNVDHAGFAGSLPRLGVAFDAVHTAQDIGSYKPDPRNFRHLLSRLAEASIPANRVLHVAQSLFHDHAPANAVGLASAWIDRRAGQIGSGATALPPAGVRWDFRFETLGALADAHRAEAAV